MSGTHRRKILLVLYPNKRYMVNIRYSLLGCLTGSSGFTFLPCLLFVLIGPKCAFQLVHVNLQIVPAGKDRRIQTNLISVDF